MPPAGESKPNLRVCAEGVDYAILDAKDPEALTEEEKIALLGRPCLGTNTKIQIRIKESKEFKVGAEGEDQGDPWDWKGLSHKMELAFDDTHG